MKRPSGDLADLIRQRSRRIRPLPTGEKEKGRLPCKPRCVLFDVYGTLLVRIGDMHARAQQRLRDSDAVIRAHNLPVTARELEILVESAIEQNHAAQRRRGKEHPEVVIERIWAGIFPHLAPAVIRRAIVEYELAAHPAWPMPGCRRLLRFLAGSDITLGIVSNAQFYTPLFLSALTGATLEDLGFSPSLCLYSFDLGTAKPDRRLVDLAVERLRGMGLSASETVMVGNDCVNDTAPAALAGLMTVYAALDRRSSVPAPGDSVESVPDAVIQRLASLRRLIVEAT